MAWAALWILNFVLVLYLLAYCFEVCRSSFRGIKLDPDSDQEDIIVMKRAGLIVPGILAIVLLLLLFFLPLFLKEKATVQIKKTTEADAREISGVLAKQEIGKAITIENEELGTQTIPWEQINSIRTTDSPVLLDLSNAINERFTASLSYLTLLGSAIAFFFAYRQYKETQKWKREEFLAATVKDFNTHPEIRNAKLMLDAFKTQTTGRKITLFPDELEASAKSVVVTHHDVFVALTPNREASTAASDAAAERKYVAIADCFDSFLSGLTRFAYYIEVKLVSKEEVETHLIYWLDLIGNREVVLKPNTPDIRGNIFLYVETYKFSSLVSLMEIYDIPGYKNYLPPAAPPLPGS